MLLWLEAFVDAHDLRSLIHFNRRVVDIMPVQIPYVEAGDCHSKGAEALQERTQQQWVVRTAPTASSAAQVSEQHGWHTQVIALQSARADRLGYICRYLSRAKRFLTLWSLQSETTTSPTC